MTTLYHARRRVFRRTLTLTKEGARRPFATISRHPTEVRLRGKSFPLTCTTGASWALQGEPLLPDASARLLPDGGVIVVNAQEYLLTARQADVSVTCDGLVVGRVARNLSNGWFLAFANVPDVVLLLTLWLVAVMRAAGKR